MAENVNPALAIGWAWAVRLLIESLQGPDEMSDHLLEDLLLVHVAFGQDAQVAEILMPFHEGIAGVLEHLHKQGNTPEHSVGNKSPK